MTLANFLCDLLPSGTRSCAVGGGAPLLVGPPAASLTCDLSLGRASCRPGTWHSPARGTLGGGGAGPLDVRLRTGPQRRDPVWNPGDG